MEFPFWPLTYQSRDVSFSEWISLLTLCLAPIVAHVLAGVPQPTYLCRRRPRWHDYLSHYNLISIIWRYAAITDRRLRTRGWGPADMAAANALFWTPAGWDGTEDMATRSVLYRVHLPTTTHASVLSWDFLKTAIVTLQGIQVMYLFTGGFAGQVRLPSFALDTISYPVAVLGLMRLFPGLWLTDDFAYAIRLDMRTIDASTASPSRRPSPGFADDSVFTPGAKDDTRRLLPMEETPTIFSHNRFRPSSYWPSRIFRLLYAAPLATLWAIALLTLLPGPWHRAGRLTMTSYLGAINATVNLFVMTVIYGYYAFRYGCRSTIIPCISATWYKVLTGLFWAVALGVMAVSAVETRRTPCGKYTTAGQHMDAFYCPGLLNVGPGSDSFGLAARVNGTNGTATSAALDPWRFKVVDFIGSCQGVLGSSREYSNSSM